MFPFPKSYYTTGRCTVPWPACHEYLGMRFRESQWIYSIGEMKSSF